MDFPEADWKHLRVVKQAALDRYCERVLRECAAVIHDSAGTAHERYLKLFKLLQKRDHGLGFAFNDMRRSRAIERIMAMRHLGVITDEEMAGFTPETQETVAFVDLNRQSQRLP